MPRCFEQCMLITSPFQRAAEAASDNSEWSLSLMRIYAFFSGLAANRFMRRSLFSMVYMQMYQTLAHLFRPGAPKLTILSTPRDVVAVHGMLFPMPPFDSEGVRVVIS